MEGGAICIACGLQLGVLLDVMTSHISASTGRNKIPAGVWFRTMIGHIFRRNKILVDNDKQDSCTPFSFERCTARIRSDCV